jgi:Fur family ferric uptake transcriptional regulator
MKNNASDLLQSVKLRQTQPRLSILRVLLNAKAPLTREQIAERIGPDAPNKTTIYRTLTHLAKTNLVHQAFMDDRTAHYELAHHCGKIQCHPHFTCNSCLQTQCLTSVRTPTVKLPKGFTIQRQQIRIEGICSDCRKKI